MTRTRIAGVAAAITLLLATLTGCPMQAEVDDDDEGDDHIHYVLTT